MSKWQCRYAPSLGALEDTPGNVWGTLPYTDPEAPAVFMGLYGLPDFIALWRHKGKKAILWCGSDITHFKNGYWLDDKGEIRLPSRQLAVWINKHCENYVENKVEQKALQGLGIGAIVVPSFLGDVKKFAVSYQWSEKPKLYTSVSGDNFELYGWDRIPQLAEDNPDVEFHLYGASVPTDRFLPAEGIKNVFHHGRVPKEQMNEEIAKMQGGLRLTQFDGFSEIIAKSVLMGQWPVSLIEYPHVLKLNEICLLKEKKEPNLEGRRYYQNAINKYPWVK